MITLVHTADWQLGRPFHGFGDRVGALLENARLVVIETIAKTARSAGARHVLVAGDVFDSETLPPRSVLPAFERMKRAEGLVWHLIPGNHDPGRPGGLWHRLVRSGVPANVRVYLEPGVHPIEPDASLLVSPIVAKGRGADPTIWMDNAETGPGVLRIGLAHGSIYDFADAGEGSGTIDPGRAQKAGLAYLALGDWHGAKRISATTWYSGTPEPDRFGDPASGQVLVVKASVGGQSVEPVRTGHYVWMERDEIVRETADLQSIEARIISEAPAPERLLLKLSLHGAVSFETRAALAAWKEQLSARLRYFAIDESRLTARAEAEDLSRLLADPSLMTVADRLRRLAREGEPKQRLIADRALSRLLEITQAVKEGQP